MEQENRWDDEKKLGDKRVFWNNRTIGVKRSLWIEKIFIPSVHLGT